MFKRKIYDTLLEWKRNDARSCALLIDGARRVGKSFDFLLSRSRLDEARNVRPVEVKSGKKATHKSLDKFVAKFGRYVEKPYLLWMKDRETRNGVDFLPIYMAPCLAEN